MKHVLYPRFPAFVQACTVLGNSGYKNVYDITILYSKRDYENGARQFIMNPSLLDFVIGQLSSDVWYIDVYIERHSLSAINLDRKNLEKWLEKSWFTKEALIDDYIAQRSSSVYGKQVLLLEEEEKLKKIKKMEENEEKLKQLKSAGSQLKKKQGKPQQQEQLEEEFKELGLPLPKKKESSNISRNIFRRKKKIN